MRTAVTNNYCQLSVQIRKDNQKWRLAQYDLILLIDRTIDHLEGFRNKSCMINVDLLRLWRYIPPLYIIGNDTVAVTAPCSWSLAVWHPTFVWALTAVSSCIADWGLCPDERSTGYNSSQFRLRRTQNWTSLYSNAKIWTQDNYQVSCVVSGGGNGSLEVDRR
jgi:hypothetical protein